MTRYQVIVIINDAETGAKVSGFEVVTTKTPAEILATPPREWQEEKGGNHDAEG